MIEAWLAGVYILGSVIGFVYGFRYGIKRGRVIMMSTLIVDGYVKTKKVDGDLVLIKVDESQI